MRPILERVPFGRTRASAAARRPSGAPAPARTLGSAAVSDTMLERFRSNRNRSRRARLPASRTACRLLRHRSGSRPLPSCEVVDRRFKPDRRMANEQAVLVGDAKGPFNPGGERVRDDVLAQRIGCCWNFRGGHAGTMFRR